jgi:hypothetical protein
MKLPCRLDRMITANEISRMRRKTRPDAALVVLALVAVRCVQALPQESQPSRPLRVPAFTAYCEPNADALHFSDRDDVTGWESANDALVWYGELRRSGALSASVTLDLPSGQTATLRLRLAGQAREAKLVGGAGPTSVDFGSFDIPTADYYRFELAGLARSGETFGRVVSLNLEGPAAEQAHFNLKPRLNAASVHLNYPIDSPKIEWFYNEVTVRTEPTHSFYMACGFHRGYFGIQVNSPTERRIIFSVWDSGNKGNDRGKVKDEDRVQLITKGDHVVANDFGGEGTGGHSHLVYPWKTGQTYRFLLTAKPEGGTTVYSAYFYFPEQSAWGLIASFRASKDGQHLRGLHSFNENFWGSNGQLQRLAEFGPPWIRTADGAWQQLTKAKFTHDATGKEDRLDYGAGVVHGGFYLSNGGFTRTPIHGGGESEKPKALKYGDTLECPPRGQSPEDIHLP